MDSIRSLHVSFYSNYLYHSLLFGFFSRHLTSSPNIRYTFVYHLVLYSLSLRDSIVRASYEFRTGR